MRTDRSLALLAALTLPAALLVGAGSAGVGPAGAAGGEPTCNGLAVTIDLNDPEAANPNRPQADVVLGTPEGDLVRTGGGADVVCGEGGGDEIDLGAGDNRGFGGGGNDVLVAGAGDDVLVGGKGRDWVDYGAAPQLRLYLGLTSRQQTGYGEDVVRSVENAIGSQSGPNRVFGSGPANVIQGGPFADALKGAHGRDHLFGGAGDDTLRGGAGSDICDGGPGENQLFSCEA